MLIWSIRPRDEKSLDIYEGWPRFYRKEDITVKLNGKPVSAMIYLMNEGHRLGMPSRAYYDTLLEGYQSAGFDRRILDDAVQESAIRFEEAPEPQMDFWNMRW